jgi:hypothetical protein
MRRGRRSSYPRPMNSARACRSMPAVPWSARNFSSATSGRRATGTTSQPIRSAGASVLLADPGVDDPVRVKPLQRPDRGAVVAVLGVVVVLDRDRVPVPQPAQKRRPALRGEDHAGRVLMRRRHGVGVGVGALEDVHAEPRAVHGDRDRLGSGTCRSARARIRASRRAQSSTPRHAHHPGPHPGVAAPLRLPPQPCPRAGPDRDPYPSAASCA